MLSLSLQRRQCHALLNNMRFLPAHLFHSAPPLLARHATKKSPELSKKQIAAKARKKILKAKKSIFDSEKMTLADAIAVLRAVEVTSPNSTYELVIKTAMSKGAPIPKGRYALPRQPKVVSKDRILVFAEGRQAEEAKRAGADVVGGPELVDGVVSGRHQASLFLCTPALIRSITPKLGRVLGPRGLMPSERRGTVTDDIATYIRRLKGTSEWKGDKAGTIRAPIAKFHYPVEDVIKNVRYFLGVVKKATGNQRDPQAEDSKSSSPKPVNSITKITLSSPQGPGIQLSDA